MIKTKKFPWDEGVKPTEVDCFGAEFYDDESIPVKKEGWIGAYRKQGVMIFRMEREIETYYTVVTGAWSLN